MRRVLAAAVAVTTVMTVVATASSAVACECSGLWNDDEMAAMVASDGMGHSFALLRFDGNARCDEGETRCSQTAAVLAFCETSLPTIDGTVDFVTVDEGCGTPPFDDGTVLAVDARHERLEGGRLLSLSVGMCPRTVSEQQFARLCPHSVRASPPTHAGCASCAVASPPASPPRGDIIFGIVVAAMVVVRTRQAARRRAVRHPRTSER